MARLSCLSVIPLYSRSSKTGLISTVVVKTSGVPSLILIRSSGGRSTATGVNPPAPWPSGSTRGRASGRRRPRRPSRSAFPAGPAAPCRGESRECAPGFGGPRRRPGTAWRRPQPAPRSGRPVSPDPIRSLRVSSVKSVLRRSHWCERGDSNPHGCAHEILSLARLPVPPLSQRIRRDTPVLYCIGAHDVKVVGARRAVPLPVPSQHEILLVDAVGGHRHP